MTAYTRYIVIDAVRYIAGVLLPPICSVC